MYECHVTLRKPQDTRELESLALEKQWKTSFIVGDPLLGKEGFFYFTTHHVDYDQIFSKMRSLADRLGTLVIREKIEHIVYDTKKRLAV
jgi:hypothetical protein